MAIINTSFDTSSKAFSVTIDGKAVENVMGYETYPAYDEPDEFRCSICTCLKDEENDMAVMTRIFAAETEQAKALKAEASASASFPGFVEVIVTDQSKAHQDIAEYFSRK